MADLTWPLNRTLFLPAGCPGLGSIEQIQADLRDLRWGSSGGQSYCLGEADVLIEYLAPLPAGQPWEGRGAASVPGSGLGPWQALLSFPFQMSGPGSLPPDRACRIELTELAWTMVGARALELQAVLHISCQEQELPSVEDERRLELEGWGVSCEDQPLKSQQPTESPVVEKLWRRKKKGGGWKMTELEDQAKQKKLDREDFAAEKADVSLTRRPDLPTEAVEMVREAQVEIVDLRADGKALKLSRAIEEALRADGTLAELAAWREQQDEEQRSISLQTEDVKPETESPPYPVPEPEPEPEPEPIMAALPADAADVSVKEEASLDEDDALAASDTVLPEAVLEQDPGVMLATAAEPERVAITEQTEAGPAVSLITVDEDQSTSAPVMTESNVMEKPRSPQSKRRFRGWPGLIVDSDHNDIDLTAFNICIKL